MYCFYSIAGNKNVIQEKLIPFTCTHAPSSHPLSLCTTFNTLIVHNSYLALISHYLCLLVLKGWSKLQRFYICPLLNLMCLHLPGFKAKPIKASSLHITENNADGIFWNKSFNKSYSEYSKYVSLKCLFKSS